VCPHRPSGRIREHRCIIRRGYFRTSCFELAIHGHPYTPQYFGLAIQEHYTTHQYFGLAIHGYYKAIRYLGFAIQ